MDVRRLRMLLELSRLGSMHEVAAELGTTTSSVSQAIAALAREAGTALVEPDGRRVRLTPAGHRLAEHAVTILAAVDAARLDLDPAAEPVGVVRVAGFATAIRRSLLPAIADLAPAHPGVELRVHEHEPPEALDLLARDDVDLALAYDYNLAPGVVAQRPRRHPAVGGRVGPRRADPRPRAPFASYADHDWIVNSRHTADEEVLRTLASHGRLHPPGRAPRRRPGARRRPHRGAARASRCCPAAAPLAAASPCDRSRSPERVPARVRRDAPWPGPLAAAAGGAGAADPR